MENTSIHEDTISINSYNEMAKYYEKFVDTKPFNAYFERPATLSLFPEIKNKKILDIGCAGGWYTKYLLDHGADVTAIDVNKNMVEITKKRIQNKCRVIQADLNNKLDFIKDSSYDIILASLVLHYIRNISNAFSEVNRILYLNGELIFSIHHPLMDFIASKDGNYMEIELMDDEWKMGEEKIRIQYFRRPLNQIFQPLIDNGFYIKNVLEPKPTNEFKERLPESYERQIKRPNFLIIKAIKIKDVKKN